MIKKNNLLTIYNQQGIYTNFPRVIIAKEQPTKIEWHIIKISAVYQCHNKS